MSRVVVRRIEPADWVSFRAVRIAALADAPYAFITTVSQAERYPEQLWRDRIAGNPHFLAEVDGASVGMAVVVAREEAPELVGVWVHPDARGSGVIEALIDASVSAARDEGSEELRLWVVEGNERAERAYARYGFSRTGETLAVPGRPDETEVEMVLSLRRRDHLTR
ncbi:MAG: GNAT family N-acetyltransferase [Actinomycetes bacterium]